MYARGIQQGSIQSPLEAPLLKYRFSGIQDVFARAREICEVSDCEWKVKCAF
jgi:hypothetical protein